MAIARQWDKVPVFGVWMRAVDESPEPGQIELTITQRVTHVDGRVIHPAGARLSVGIGNVDQQDAEFRSLVRAAWRAVDEALLGDAFDGLAWDVWWDTKIVPAAIFARFPAVDDPDIVQDDLQVKVAERLTSASGREYYIEPRLSHLELPIPGVNLGMIEVPPGSPIAPAPVYAKGIAGGVAALDVDGDVLNAAGEKLLPGGGGLDDSAVADLVTDEGSATREALDDLLGGKADTAGLAAVATSGAYADLSGRPAIPATAGDVGADPAGTAAGLVGAITPTSIGAAASADLDGYVPLVEDAAVLYGTDPGGDQTAYPLAVAATPGTVPRRDSSGHVTVGATPSAATHAASKGYVDGAVGGLADVATSGSYTDLSDTPTIPTTAADVGAAAASHSHPSTGISDSTSVGRNVLTASSQANARSAIGAGTSSLALGSTGSTAKAGNWQPAAADVSDSTATGRDLLTAVDAAAARSAIGAAQTLDQDLVLVGFGPTPPDPTGLPDGRVWFLTPED